MKAFLTGKQAAARNRRIVRWAGGAGCWALLAVCLGCAFPKRSNMVWPPMPHASEEVHVRLERITTGLQGKPFAGMRVLAGDETILLLVDTGTSTTILRKSLKRKLELKKYSKTEIEGGDRWDSQHLYSTSSLRVGPLEFTDEIVAFLPDHQMDRMTGNSKTRVDGIIGATLLRRGEIEFRGPDDELIIRPFEQSKIRADDSSIPLIFLPTWNTYAIPLRTDDGRGARLLLDTGTNVPLVLAEHRPLARKVVSTEPVGRLEYDFIHGDREVRVYRLPFSIQGPGVHFPVGCEVCVDSRRKGPLDGVIGIPIFWKTERILINSDAELISFSGEDLPG